MPSLPDPSTPNGGTQPPEGWSIFAATLEAILADPKHGATPLSRLDDIQECTDHKLYPGMQGSPFVLVHRERLRRLEKSRKEPGNYPTLNSDDMARVARYFRLERVERLRLDAALITTAIERTIKERLDDGSGRAASHSAAIRAHPIAQRLFPLILSELEQMPDHGDHDFDADFRSSQGRTGEIQMAKFSDPSGDEMIDQALEPALDAIDRAILALALSHQIAPHAERIERAHTAKRAFREALSELDDIEEQEIRTSDLWHVWFEEAQRGLTEAQERLQDLGG